VQWLGVTGGPDWSYSSHSFAFFLKGSSVEDPDLYVMVNSYWESLDFTIQQGMPDEWFVVIDTSKSSPLDIVERSSAKACLLTSYNVGPRSVVVLVRTKSSM
jgi:isoamylase